MIIASAPAKTILFGEHFVVRGCPAIAIALNVRSNVKVSEHGDLSIKVKSLNLGEEMIVDLNGKPVKLSPNLTPYTKIFEMLANYCNLKQAYIEIKSDIPIAAGLGSSASIAVALTAAYSRYLGLSLSLDEISRIAYESEKIVHGKPSGIDNSIATYGGGIVFEKGKIRRINIDKLSEAFIIIANTGIERSTRDAVLKVLRLYDKYESILMHVYEASRNLVNEAIKHIEEGNLRELGELMNINHGLLSAIGVSLLELEELVYIARKAGALGSKITGAGLGGCIIALSTKDNVEEVERALKVKAKWVLKASLSMDGVRVMEKEH